jgi:hypothetical protein
MHGSYATYTVLNVYCSVLGLLAQQICYMRLISLDLIFVFRVFTRPHKCTPSAHDMICVKSYESGDISERYEYWMASLLHLGQDMNQTQITTTPGDR